jgi:hypothetical protein
VFSAEEQRQLAGYLERMVEAIDAFVDARIPDRAS